MQIQNTFDPTMTSHSSQSFFTQYPGTFCLIDESRLNDSSLSALSSSSSAFSGKSNSFLAGRQSSGFISLSNEFTKRNALVTTWGKQEIAHLITFLKYYYHQQIYQYTHQSMLSVNSSGTGGGSGQGLSLLDAWHEHAHSSASSTVSPHPVNGNNSTHGRGMLAYEIRIQIGIVLRSNTVLGIRDDCWRFLYVQELQSYGRPAAKKGNAANQQNTDEEEEEVCFGQYLSQFFPQLKPIFRMNGGVDFSNILIKYYPHHLPESASTTGLDATSSGGNNMSATSPPARPDSTSAGGAGGYCYQTLGTLDELTTDIFARFDHNYSLCFHDIVLESI
jgi:hypothetical protein